MKSFLLIILTIFVINIPTYADTPCGCERKSFADLVEPLIPAVVNINATIKHNNMLRHPGVPPEHFKDLFEQFFDRYGAMPGIEETEREEPKSVGSGFIIDPKGYIVTNHHVVNNTEKITITLNNDLKYEAKLIGSDDGSDLALLKIEADKPLPFVLFGNSDTARIGDEIIAIGNPFGLSGTVTSGIISAMSRSISSDTINGNFIQTDAAINRGNSGGPLFNLKGEVIGINSSIYSTSGGGSMGIGFAVPSSFAKPLIEQLKKSGKIKRTYLGVTIQSTAEIAEGLGIEHNKGALVADVLPHGPAAKAGIIPGDILLKYDGKEIVTSRTLPRLVAETAIGQQVDIELLSKGKKKTIKVTLEELEEKVEKATTPELAEHQGLTLSELTPVIRNKYGIRPQIQGVLVMSIATGSSAAKAGIIPGDIIISANQEPINKVNQFVNIVDDLKKSYTPNSKKSNKLSVMLQIKRGKITFFVNLTLK